MNVFFAVFHGSMRVHSAFKKVLQIASVVNITAAKRPVEKSFFSSYKYLLCRGNFV